MQLTVLGSGSRGNALVLTADGFTLLLDAGFSVRSLRRRARATGIDLGAVGAVLLSHEHLDHARSGALLASYAACPLYASAGTLERLGVEGDTLGHLETREIGPFTVTTCRVAHDAAEPMAFAVVGPDGARLGVAYDLGRAAGVVRYVLRGADCLVVEANHDAEMLRAAPYPASVRNRIGGPEGHLSNAGAGALLAELWHPALRTVILAHLSEQCNRPAVARETVAGALRVVRFAGELRTAGQDEPLDPLTIAPARSAALS